MQNILKCKSTHVQENPFGIPDNFFWGLCADLLCHQTKAILWIHVATLIYKKK